MPIEWMTSLRLDYAYKKTQKYAWEYVLVVSWQLEKICDENVWGGWLEGDVSTDVKL